MQLIPAPKKLETAGGTCAQDVKPNIKTGAEGIPAQGYRLSIQPEGVSIAAADDVGAFYAEQTLQQIAEQAGDAGMPCLTIEDWPDFSVRGYMLEVSRDRVPTMEHLLYLVDILASLRYNQLQLYTEHTFAYPGHEVVWGMASPMTAGQVKALDAYCAARHIELVPNQNSFGHFERWLKHKEYKNLAECPDGFWHHENGFRPHGGTLRPDDCSLELLDGLYTELLPNFKSKKFNVGCDEPWELGQGWSKPQAEKEGKHAVYSHFLKRICELAAKHGTEPMCWADILMEDPQFIDQLPDNLTPILWGYHVGHPYDKECDIMAKTKRPYYVAPGDSTWNSYSGRVENMCENIRIAASEGHGKGASGLLLTHWGDQGHGQTWPTTLPGLIVAALTAWDIQAGSKMQLAQLVNDLFFKGDDCTAAEVLLELGDVDLLVPATTWNHSFLFATIVWPLEQARKELVNCPNEALEKVIEQCNKWERTLASASIKADDADWLREELGLSIAMVRFSARRSLEIKACSGDSEKFSLSPELRSELAQIIGVYERLWINRSRIGGLHESANNLRRLM